MPPAFLFDEQGITPNGRRVLEMMIRGIAGTQHLNAGAAPYHEPYVRGLGGLSPMLPPARLPDHELCREIVARAPELPSPVLLAVSMSLLLELSRRVPPRTPRDAAQ